MVIFVLLEVLLRLFGHQPYQHTDFKVVSSPPMAYTGHPTLGIQLNEGIFDITINERLTFRATHLPGSYRKVSEETGSSNPEALMLGCSYTYGYGVNDEENFTALLQQRYPHIQFRNAGVVGHGTVQSLLRLREMLRQKRPKWVLLNFSSYHFMRNTLSQQYRSHLKIGYSRASKSAQNQMAAAHFPFLTSCDEPIQQAPWDEIYENWPGRESVATVHALQKSHDLLLDDVDHQIKVTACLMKEMARLCKEKGIAFYVACLDPSPATEKLKVQVSDLSWFDIGYSFSDTTMTNYPYDDHPNPKGHRFIANQIDQYMASAFLVGQESSRQEPAP